MAKQQLFDEFIQLASNERQHKFLKFNERTSCLRDVVAVLREDIKRPSLTKQRFDILRRALEQRSPKDSIKYKKALDFVALNWFKRLPPPIPQKPKTLRYSPIADFNQSTVMSSTTSTGFQHINKAANTGACHNFTIEWISLMDEDKGEVSDLLARNRMAKLSKRGGAGNPILQKIFGERWAEGDYEIADEGIIRWRRLKQISPIAIAYKTYVEAELIDKIQAPSGSGFIYSFWFPGSVPGATGGAHTIGFYRTLVGKRGRLMPVNKYISAFDPNYGEYQIDEDYFSIWLARLKRNYGGAFNHHMLKFVSGNDS